LNVYEYSVRRATSEVVSISSVTSDLFHGNLGFVNLFIVVIQVGKIRYIKSRNY